MKDIEILAVKLQGDIRSLQSHPIYTSINDLNDLRVFMSVHVFAVWDFMTLLKSLQRSLTNVSIPWVPSRDPYSARLINEIVLEEESDRDHKGNPCSHLELYLSAMHEVGASTVDFQTFLGKVEGGSSLQAAQKLISIPQFVANFMEFNVDTATNANVYEVAASFVFGRETIIPQMFTNFLCNWGISTEAAPAMHYYLQRHIDLDGGVHGPASYKLLENLIKGRSKELERSFHFARRAIQERIKLWNGLHMMIIDRSSNYNSALAS